MVIVSQQMKDPVDQIKRQFLGNAGAVRFGVGGCRIDRNDHIARQTFSARAQIEGQHIGRVGSL